MPQLPDTDTAHQAALATGKLVVAFGTPLFGLITSLLSNVEAWLPVLFQPGNERANTDDQRDGQIGDAQP